LWLQVYFRSFAINDLLTFLAAWEVMSLLTSLVTGGCRQLREINESRLLKGDVNLWSKLKIKDKRRRSFLEVSVEIEGSAVRAISF
jgi:hypothetical protein